MEILIDILSSIIHLPFYLYYLYWPSKWKYCKLGRNTLLNNIKQLSVKDYKLNDFLERQTITTQTEFWFSYFQINNILETYRNGVLILTVSNGKDKYKFNYYPCQCCNMVGWEKIE